MIQDDYASLGAEHTETMVEPSRCSSSLRCPNATDTENNESREFCPLEGIECSSFDGILEIGLVLEDSDTANSNEPLSPGS